MRSTQEKKIVNIIPPAARLNNATATVLSPGYLDTQGYHYISYIFSLGATDIAVAALNITECETTGGSYTVIPLSDYSVSPLTLPTSSDGNHLFAVYVPITGIRARYQKPVFTAGNGSSGTFISAVAILDPEQLPYNATTRGNTQDTIVVG